VLVSQRNGDDARDGYFSRLSLRTVLLQLAQPKSADSLQVGSGLAYDERVGPPNLWMFQAEELDEFSSR